MTIKINSNKHNNFYHFIPPLDTES